MANPATNTLKSVLCSSTWAWSPDGKCTVKFNEDGTGDLKCGVELNAFIANQFDWEMRSKADDQTTLPGKAEIAMTLTKRDMKHARCPPTTPLSDTAFRQKIYNLELEKGAFKVEGRTTFGHNPTYRYRLLWDISPYPPLEEWDKRLPAQAGRYWERKDFYKDEGEASG